jgi:DNA-binding MarR family transcriptional regulator
MADANGSPQPPESTTTGLSNDSLAELLNRADRYVTQRLTAALQKAGLTIDQWRAIAALADGQDHPMSALAERAMLAPATLTRLVDRLAETNVIHRQADTSDRRRILVRLSTRGHALHESAADVVEGEEQALATALGQQPVRHLTGLLRQLTDLA